MSRPKKISIIAGLLVLLTAGVAVAAWLVTGTGTGAGKAAKAQDLVVTAGTAVGDLYPGFPDGDLYLEVTNPNAFPVKLTGATVTGPVTPVECKVTARSGALTVPDVTIDAGATAKVTLQDVLSMGSDPADTCQDADLTVAGVKVTGQTP